MTLSPKPLPRGIALGVEEGKTVLHRAFTESSHIEQRPGVVVFEHPEGRVFLQLPKGVALP